MQFLHYKRPKLNFFKSISGLTKWPQTYLDAYYYVMSIYKGYRQLSVTTCMRCVLRTQSYLALKGYTLVYNLSINTIIHYSRISVIRTSIIWTLQSTKYPKYNSSMCRHEELLDHTPSLVLYNIFSMVFSYLNISVIWIPLSPNVFR